MSAAWYTRPVLRVSEIDAAVAFYTERLGFVEEWRFEPPGETPLISQVARSGCELILSCQRPATIGAGMLWISLDLDVLEALRDELEAKGVGVRDGRWGYRVMIVEDVDGNQLHFPYPADGAPEPGLKRRPSREGAQRT
jgi:catechol 2,3-dioxygenase-like lactoylglutathione lyase family enzyme